MKIKTIQIIVSPDGETRLETKGFSGAECQQASRFLEDALGKQISERLTSEFHQAETRGEVRQRS